MCSENKGADQLRSYCEVDLRLCLIFGSFMWLTYSSQLHLHAFIVCLFDMLFSVPVNSNGHVGTLSPFYKTFTQHWDNHPTGQLRFICVDGST